MAGFNTKGAFWGFEIRARQLAGVWPTSAFGSVPESQYGWFTSAINVRRLDFNSDSTALSTRGPLTIKRTGGGATGNSEYGWFGGGYTGPPTYLRLSSVDRIDYAVDTETAITKGPLSLARNNGLSATGNLAYGWFTGGFTGTNSVSTVDRINYAADTSTAVARGPLTAQRTWHASTSNNNYGWFAGGNFVPGATSRIDRITYATDTATASIRGPLSSARGSGPGGSGNNNYGWFGGGFFAFSTVDRVDYSSDSTTATVRGPLSLARWYLGATGTKRYGWFLGGNSPSGSVSRIDRIDYSVDTADASIRGSTINETQLYGAGGYPG